MFEIKKTLVFTATYNEAENIEKLVKLIKSLSSKPDILIIDDNSPDGTSGKIKKLQSIYKNIYLTTRPKKLGLDSAHKQAYTFAKENDYDFLITMDADLSHDPNEIENFIKHLNDKPFVIGSRYIEGGKCVMKGKRLVLSKYGNLLIKYLLKIPSNEFTTSYRGFNIKMLKYFDLNNVSNKGYSFFMGTIVEISKQKIPIKEIPIIFKDRKKGYSKIPKLEIFRTLKNLFFIMLKN